MESEFQRSKHNKENPYCQISKVFCRLSTETLSLDSRGFLLYFLSFQDGYKFHSEKVRQDLNISKTKYYRLIDDLRKNGFMLREHFFDGNLRRYKYIYSEYAIDEYKLIYIEQKNEENSNNFSDVSTARDLEETSSNNFSDVSGAQDIEPLGQVVTRIKEKEEEYISPIVPKGDGVASPKKQKKTTTKIKEDKEEKDFRVAVTKSQHESLLLKANGDESLVASWYARLSQWKIGAEVDIGSVGKNDYKAIINWVISTVEKENKNKKEKQWKQTQHNKVDHTKISTEEKYRKDKEMADHVIQINPKNSNGNGKDLLSYFLELDSKKQH